MRIAATLLVVAPLLVLLGATDASAQVLGYAAQWPLGPPDEPNDPSEPEPFTSLEVSPDGLHLYVVQSNNDTLRTFARDPATGLLTAVQTLAESDPGVEGLDGARDVTVSPDGQHVYVTGARENSVAWFLRDPNSGALAYQARIVNGTGGLAHLQAPAGLDVSPDGQNVYVTAAAGNALVVFDRDPPTGALTLVEEHFTDVADPNNPLSTPGLVGAIDVDVHPEGIQVYAVSYFDQALVRFQRASDGTLQFGGGFQFAGLRGARSVQTTHDGETVYVAAEQYLTYASTLSVFDTDDGAGNFSFVEMETNGVNGVAGMGRAFSLAVSPDDDFVYVAGNFTDSIAIFERDPATGAVDYVDLIADSFGADGLDEVTGLAVSPDSAHLYSGSRHDPAGAPTQGDDALALFEIDADEDGWPTADDNCPYEPNPGQEDSGGQKSGFGGGDGSPDGIGDACQCGDVSGNGVVDISDVVLYRRHFAGLPGPWSEGRCSVVGPAGICDATDVVIMRRTFGALPPGIGQVCAAALP